MAPRTKPRPRCDGCITRGRTSKCNRKSPCSMCVNKDTVHLCQYSAGSPLILPRVAPPSPPASPTPAPRHHSTRGIRQPIDRDTPSDCPAPPRSFLAPPPLVPAVGSPPDPMHPVDITPSRT
ncbi:hypothetical protein RHS01_11481 [Rhizoctonia solani]|uniref:Zn(2)-C6 fungal-type domain-containing protein n=1 Tax=Rhizoctonia solani TaxID=456999 RepID=A0A8H7I1I0_9AGAM|nr:hypothetical protein RHS01_11481 [Rhizoctonia solani]